MVESTYYFPQMFVFIQRGLPCFMHETSGEREFSHSVGTVCEDCSEQICSPEFKGAVHLSLGSRWEPTPNWWFHEMTFLTPSTQRVHTVKFIGKGTIL
jgi:hypothetical protein